MAASDRSLHESDTLHRRPRRKVRGGGASSAIATDCMQGEPAFFQYQTRTFVLLLMVGKPPIVDSRTMQCLRFIDEVYLMFNRPFCMVRRFSLSLTIAPNRIFLGIIAVFIHCCRLRAQNPPGSVYRRAKIEATPRQLERVRQSGAETVPRRDSKRRRYGGRYGSRGG